MDSRERVLNAINHKETDRVPFDMFGTSQPNKDRIKAHFGFSSNEEMYKALGIDIWYLNGMPFTGSQRYFNGEAADYWGITPKARSDGDSSGLCPLAEICSVDEAEAYQWPKAVDFYAGDIEKDIENHNGFAILGGVWAPIFHNVTWLCGFENTLVYLHTQPEVMQAVIRHVTDFWVDYTKKVLENGKGKIDIIENCNDFGTQECTIMSPAMFRKFFKPELKRLYDVIKAYDVKVMQHSCGSIYELIPDFIEIGADIINPVQVSAKNMDIADLKAKYGQKITFHGGVDTQYILPKGSPDDVRSEVRRILSIMHSGNGYILSGSQGFESDISVENIAAMYDEGKKFSINI